ncbi:MAG: hypothetical protein KME25_32295 [Symplocastrum torsivum CPER-KK1]|jgi:hypothetical protein|uniref:KGK family protein n=1 Tax=Symplocastrum torsivum CPER-KK1 TaxID=450513 RepID=A0A951PS17_9CYAN|nr:hypothetical protein [Symplocastrum torsivum CPER-KK1]
MSEFYLDPDDVISMKQQESLVGNNATFKIDQLEKRFRDMMGGTNPTTQGWMRDGVECEFLSASTGKGWQKGKIRVRFEFVPDEPEPSPDANFLDDLRKDITTEQ